MIKTALLVIDAQYDFCNPNGTLFVPGAEKDVERIANLISLEGDKIDAIFLTLDTHKVLDIAHPLFWEDQNGNTVAPFTLISRKSVEAGKWVPRYHHEFVLKYLQTLETEGEFQHFIWPEHCLIGSKGAALDDTLMNAVLAWTHRTRRDYRTVSKGINPLTEHFGVFKAQVPVANAPETELDERFLHELNEYDQVLVAGEARSHCVATSIRQIVKFAPSLAPKVVVLTDCMSDVPNFGHLADAIYEEAAQNGMTFAKANQVFSGK
ncbi:isochorismatase family protein [Dyadobacter sp. CY261]|uniref:isochorismatase family protein n=1 Tax=Dyadobacter sp. CY261 TaxID=2907203 RepID=UPI001F484485|nr:isochorismatase family protein [Dyadobacter sp. CY261]MCF0072634.1 isochorismatase family protein [Dyadobacter sp. CY261]